VYFYFESIHFPDIVEKLESNEFFENPKENLIEESEIN